MPCQEKTAPKPSRSWAAIVAACAFDARVGAGPLPPIHLRDQGTW